MNNEIILPDWTVEEYERHKRHIPALPEKIPQKKLSEIVFSLSSMPISHFDAAFKFEDGVSMNVQRVSYDYNHFVKGSHYDHKFVGFFYGGKPFAWKQVTKQGSSVYSSASKEGDVSRYLSTIREWDEFVRAGVIDPSDDVIMNYFARALRIVSDLSATEYTNSDFLHLLSRPNYHAPRESTPATKMKVRYFKGIDSRIPLLQNGVSPELSGSGELLRNPS